VGITARGNVSRRYQLLCEQRGTPDLKILTGDQVYLDTPLVLPMGAQSVRRRISRNYSRTWDKLGYFLSHGANICASDDHEWWNDYPNRPPLLTNLPGLRVHDTRDEWDATAREFIRKVQLAEPVVTFDLGDDLSFFVADTRINRDAAQPADQPDPAHPPKFMKADDFESLISWIERLRCPGVLVIGQPLLANGGNPLDRARPTRLFEVISSPMALVSLFHGRFGLAKGVFSSDITMFPLDSGESPEGPTTLVGEARDEVGYAPPVRSTGRRCEDHYMTLEFTKLGGDAGIKVDVLAHLLRKPPGNTSAQLQPISTFVLGAPGAAGEPDYR
jgi:hypothetical protein